MRSGVTGPPETACIVCGRSDGQRYTGPFYSVNEVDPPPCLHCVADGSLASTFDGVTVDVYGAPTQVPVEVIDEIQHRTPSFAGWQQERWLFHCSDGMAYIGRADEAMLADARVEAAVESAASDYGVDRAALHRTFEHGELASLLIHVFRCLHCDAYSAYGDPD